MRSLPQREEEPRSTVTAVKFEKTGEIQATAQRKEYKISLKVRSQVFSRKREVKFEEAGVVQSSAKRGE